MVSVLCSENGRKHAYRGGECHFFEGVYHAEYREISKVSTVVPCRGIVGFCLGPFAEIFAVHDVLAQGQSLLVSGQTVCRGCSLLNAHHDVGGSDLQLRTLVGLLQKKFPGFLVAQIGLRQLIAVSLQFFSETRCGIHPQTNGFADFQLELHVEIKVLFPFSSGWSGFLEIVFVEKGAELIGADLFGRHIPSAYLKKHRGRLGIVALSRGLQAMDKQNRPKGNSEYREGLECVDFHGLLVL